MDEFDKLDGFDTFFPDKKKIHIIMKQRNTKKRITQITGLDDKYDKDKICSALAHLCKCSVSYVDDYIQLTGDQRTIVYNFLVKQIEIEEHNIIMHGV